MSKALRNEADVVKAQATSPGEHAHETVLERPTEEPRIVDEICVEELAIDGICGVY